MRSLRSRLLLIWAISLLAALAVGAPLIQLYRAQGRAVEGREQFRLARTCDSISDRYGYYVSGWAGPESASVDLEFRRGLQIILNLALDGAPDLDAGIWRLDDGILLPTTPDPGLRDAVATVAASALADDRDANMSLSTASGTLLLHACALPGPIAGLAAFVIAHAVAPPGLVQARIGVAVLAGLVIATTIGVGIVLVGYTSRIARIESALTLAGTALPHLPLTGERDLDRLVAAFNRTAVSLEEARTREIALDARVAQAERLAALGRVAAGVAHEIRNPIAAMRLRAENALAGDMTRRGIALSAILQQIDRLDRLAGELLDMTRPLQPVPEPVALAALLRDEAPAGVAVNAPTITLQVDPTLLRRAIGNLIRNAIRAGGLVTLAAEISGNVLTVTITDTGPGIPPALRESLFDPFVTGHADGTGLGLPIAREAARALGGTLVLTNPGGAENTCFTLTLPVTWPVS